MDVVAVPLVWHEAEVGPSLELLRRRERAGLVVHHQSGGPDRYSLLYVGALIEARRDGVRTVGQVPGGHTVQVVDKAIAQSFGLDLARPHGTWQQYETMLDRHSVEYALVETTRNACTVVTRHEELAYLLSTTATYWCNGPNWHTFPEPRVSIGDPCPKRPFCGRDDSTIEAYPG
jgi:hypothetical protein